MNKVMSDISDNENPSEILTQEDSSSGHEDELTEINRYWPPPIEQSVELLGSLKSKTISAFAFNNSGTRFAAGGHDYEVRIWDFAAINKERPEPICNSQPSGQTIIKNLQFSLDDELVLVISGSCQASIIAKDGLLQKQYQCPKGDQYITDMFNTKGHVQMLNDGCWSTKDRQTFLTCSNDCTLRIWDLNSISEKQKTVIKTRSPSGGQKAIPNVCKFNRDSTSIVTGCNDGCVLFWDTRRKFITTSACIRNAHLKGSELTGLDFAYGNQHLLATRSEDETCKLWDARNLKNPIATQGNLTTTYPSTDCSFSPDDKYILTGTSSLKQEPAKLCFLNSNDLTIESSIELPAETSAIRARWHPKINHIGYTCSNGSCFVTYDSKRSMGGFLSVPNKGVKRKKYISQQELSSISKQKIITPHALPLFQDAPSKSSFAKIRQDPKRSYKPEMPASNQGGKVRPAGSTLSSFIAKNIAKPVDDGGLDIRERLLRHKEEAEKNPIWIKGIGQSKTMTDSDNDKQQDQ